MLWMAKGEEEAVVVPAVVAGWLLLQDRYLLRAAELAEVAVQVAVLQLSTLHAFSKRLIVGSNGHSSGSKSGDARVPR